MHGNSEDVVRVSKKCMNKSAGMRLISKQESVVLMGELDLFTCTETVETVSISNSKRIRTNGNGSTDSNNYVNEYMNRPEECALLSMYRYFVETKNYAKTAGQKQVIPHFVGISGKPSYPPTEDYAKYVLVVHKPWWGRFPTSDNWIEDFLNFINTPDIVPTEVSMEYMRVMQRYYCGNKFVQPVAKDGDHSGNAVPDDIQALINLTGVPAKHFDDDKTNLIKSMDRGIEFQWDKKPKVITSMQYGHKITTRKHHTTKSKKVHLTNLTFIHDQNRRLADHTPPEDWLVTKVQEPVPENAPIRVPLKQNGDKYAISDLYDDQKFVVEAVMKKLKEWVETDDLETFQPLRLTLNGSGGCGKSVIINTLVTVIRTMFNQNGVVRVAAPTGTAAFNVGGKTLHSLMHMGVDTFDYKANSLNDFKRAQFVSEFGCLLALIIDERSLINSKDLGTVEAMMSETIYRGGLLDKLSFGGLPVVILVGDDYQLPPSGSGAVDAINQAPPKSKMVMNGRKIFRDCAEDVIELTESKRLNKKRNKDRVIIKKVRTQENLSEKEVSKLLSLHLDAVEQKHGEKGKEIVSEIKSRAMFLFFRNEPRITHNWEKIKEVHSKERPVGVFRCRGVGCVGGKPVRKHFNCDPPSAAIFCEEAQVALENRNFNPEWGLHNSACGRVDEIVFAKGENPNRGHLPSYVVVDFPLYCGPAWDLENPTVSNGTN